MAASRIRGITVEIGGDTTGLDKALKSVNSTIKDTQSQLKDVERLLKLDPSNTELLTQKQKLLKESISATKEKLDSLKTAQDRQSSSLKTGRWDRKNTMPFSVKLLKPSRNWRNSPRKLRRQTQP